MKIERRRPAAALVMACGVVLGAILWAPAVAGTVQEKGAVDVAVDTAAAVDMPVNMTVAPKMPLMSDGQAEPDGSGCRREVSPRGTHQEVHQWVCADPVELFFSQIEQLIGMWISELLDGWIADCVQFLTVLLVRPPLIALWWLASKSILPLVAASSAILFLMRTLIKRASGLDLSAVVRWTAIPCLIVLPGILLQSFASLRQLMMLDSALASAVRGGIAAGVGGLASFFVPLLGGWGGAYVGLIGEVFAFVGLVAFAAMGAGMVLLLLAGVVARAVHVLLLCLELIDWRRGCSNPEFMRGTCLSFLLCAWKELQWIVLLRLLVEVSFSDANPWIKIVMDILLLWQAFKVMSGQVRLDLVRFALRG